MVDAVVHQIAKNDAQSRALVLQSKGLVTVIATKQASAGAAESESGRVQLKKAKKIGAIEAENAIRAHTETKIETETERRTENERESETRTEGARAAARLTATKRKRKSANVRQVQSETRRKKRRKTKTEKELRTETQTEMATAHVQRLRRCGLRTRPTTAMTVTARVE